MEYRQIRRKATEISTRGFCAFQTSIVFHPKVFHHTRHSRQKKLTEKMEKNRHWECTHTKNSGIVGNGRGSLRCWRLFDTEVLYITATEYNVLVDLVCRCYLLLGLTLATLCAVGYDILKRNCRVLRVDAVQYTRVANITFGDERNACSDID